MTITREIFGSEVEIKLTDAEIKKVCAEQRVSAEYKRPYIVTITPNKRLDVIIDAFNGIEAKQKGTEWLQTHKKYIEEHMQNGIGYYDYKVDGVMEASADSLAWHRDIKDIEED